MTKSALLFILSFLLLLGCAKKKVPVASKNYDANNISDIVEKASLNQVNFNTLEADFKTSYKGSKSSLNFRAHVRIQKDEKIWLSARMLGFEGVRALVTPDSVKMINRLERVYALESIDKLEEMTNLPINFSMLQAVMTGDLLLFNEQDVDITTVEPAIELVTTLESLMNTILFQKESLLIQQQTLTNSRDDQEMTVQYSDYKSLENRFFSMKRFIEGYAAGEEIEVELNFNDVTLNEELSFPFEISDRYERQYY